MLVEPIAGALGAEISGLDLASRSSNAEAQDLRQAFLQYRVLFFRDQSLSPEALVRFGRMFSDLEIYPFIKGLPEAPEVIEILKTESDTVNFGGSWHSDMSYMECPPMATALYALEVPAVGGDTQFANTHAAYQGLSDGMRRMLESLVGINSSEGPYQGGRAAAMSRLAGMSSRYDETAEVHEARHPVVRTHPETGCRSLYINPVHTRALVDMTEQESRPLLEFLFRHMVRPEFTCRFRWQPGSLAIWDNRTTMHYALNDYHGARRRMQRITLRGDRPVAH